MYAGHIQPFLYPSIERLKPAQSPAGNETRNTNPDNPEIELPISSNKET
jgi:hypothetical protein